MSTLQQRAFRPLGNNKTVNVITTTGSSTLTIPDVPYGTRSLRIVNSGADISFIEFAERTITAAITTSMPMLPNTVEVFTLANDITGLRIIGAAGGNTVYITYGEGL